MTDNAQVLTLGKHLQFDLHICTNSIFNSDDIPIGGTVPEPVKYFINSFKDGE